MSKSFVVLVFSIAFVSSSFSQTAEVNLPQLIKICESYKDNIKDVNMEYTFEMIDPQSNVKYVNPQKGVFIGIKPFEKFYKSILLFRVEDLKGNIRGSQDNIACDGNTYSTSEGTSKEIKLFDRIEMTPLHFTTYKDFENTNLLDVIKGKTSYKIVYDPNIKKVNDFNTIEIAFYREGFFVPASKLFFSIDHNYVLIKVDRNISTRNNAILAVLRLKDLGNGIWFPTKAVYEFPDTRYKQTFTVEKIAINQGLTGKNLINE